MIYDMRVVLETAGDGTWAVHRLGARGEIVEEIRGAIPVSTLCRRLGKSRRQAYRYLKDGTLVAVGKFLGEWLVDPQGVDLLCGRARRHTPLPASARVLFPEYDFADLHPIRNAALIVPKIMEMGDRREIAWMLRRYPARWLKAWMAREGWRLPPRAARFWSWWLGTPPPCARRLGAPA